MKPRNISASRAAGDSDRPGTRAQLLEIAGRVFADKGFDAATGKEICELAAANVAAVVYHFGGMEQLYAAVLEEARNRLVSTEMLATIIATQDDPKHKLESLIGLLVKTLAGPASQSWAARVLGREIISPSKSVDELVDRELQGRARLLKRLVSELTGLPEEHPAVARGAVSLVGPCLMLLIVNRRRFERAFPAFGLRPESTQDITRQMTLFVLAGLTAVGRQARAARDL